MQTISKRTRSLFHCALSIDEVYGRRLATVTHEHPENQNSQRPLWRACRLINSKQREGVFWLASVDDEAIRWKEREREREGERERERESNKR